jgi:hypothetical protein
MSYVGFKGSTLSVLCAVVALATPVHANTVVPNFTRGTINATTDTTTKIVEVIRQIDYTTGSSYTVTGTNITFTGTPAPGKYLYYNYSWCSVPIQ